MPRIARVVVPGVPHHVTQRGNNRQDVFFVADDRRVYLKFLGYYAREFGLEVLGYCLMSNHVHLIGVPETEETLAVTIGRTNLRYTQYLNRLHDRVGHLWQNRFYSCPLDEAHGIAALRYIEQNPVHAGIVRKAWRYPWSSASAHVGGTDDSKLLTLSAWQKEWTPTAWRQTLSRPMKSGMVEAICKGTSRGRPLGSDSFLSKVEGLIGRRVRAMPVGRPQGWRKRSKRRR